MDFRPSTARDPFCVAIEAMLQVLENDGQGALQKAIEQENVSVKFGDISAEAFSYDIALVRLASLMIEDPRYTQTIVELIRKARVIPTS